MSDDDEVRVDHESLNEFVREVLLGAGMQPDHAETLAEALVTANLRGIDTHGVVRLAPYVRKMEQGGYNPEPEVTVTRLRPSALSVDADDGPGQIATLEAMDATIDAARETGSAWATVENSNHFGTAAFYTMRAAREDCIGFAMTVAGPNVAPFGGIDPYFGTNPIAYSVPTNGEFPITLDMATSEVAKGKVILAEEEGKSIPEGWALTEEGEPATDPSEVHAMKPAGGPKGYGLGLLVDVCAGLLSGMGGSRETPSLYADQTEPQRIGHIVGAIDVAAFRDVPAFKADLDGIIDDLKAARTREGIDEIKLPGELEYETRAEREAGGVPIGPGVRSTLDELGERYDVATPW